VVQEGGDGVRAGHARREEQRGVVRVVRGVDPATLARAQHRARLRAVVHGGEVQRGATERVVVVRVHAVVAQERDDVGVAARGGEEQGAHPALVPHVRRRARRDERGDVVREAEVARGQKRVRAVLLELGLLALRLHRGARGGGAREADCAGGESGGREARRREYMPGSEKRRARTLVSSSRDIF
jgi:hypothetical protein